MNPTADYVMVEPRPDPSGLLILPPGVSGRDQAFRAVVLAVGPWVEDELAVGAEVLVRRPEGDPSEHERLFVRLDRIVAVLE